MNTAKLQSLDGPGGNLNATVGTACSAPRTAVPLVVVEEHHEVHVTPHVALGLGPQWFQWHPETIIATGPLMAPGEALPYWRKHLAPAAGVLHFDAHSDLAVPLLGVEGASGSPRDHDIKGHPELS